MFGIDQEVTVMTYFSSRLSGRVEAPQTVNGNEGFHSSNSAFENFQINIQESLGLMLLEGAVSTYTSSAIAMVAAITTFAF